VAVVAAAALVLVLALSLSGGDDKPGRTEVGGTSTSGEQASGGQTTPSGSGTTEQPGAGSTGSTGSAGTTGSVPASGPVSTPEAAVQGFYTRAADHKFDEAWALASPRLRSQLQGYNSFKGTFDTLQSIKFSNVKANGDTVSFQSVATHTDHVDRCKGTADTVQSGENRLLDHISVACSRG
jgi:hypothetical protein